MSPVVVVGRVVERDRDTGLKVRRGAVVHFQPQRGAGCHMIGADGLAEQIILPMPGIGGFGIVGGERRPRQRRIGPQQKPPQQKTAQQKRREQNCGCKAHGHALIPESRTGDNRPTAIRLGRNRPATREKPHAQLPAD